VARSPPLEALLNAYRAEILWMNKKAEENGANRLIADDYLHRARNLQATIDALMGLDARESKNAKDP
jgi:hypothetical protein